MPSEDLKWFTKKMNIITPVLHRTYFCRNCLAPENYLKDIFRLLIRRMTKRKKSRRMNNKCTHCQAEMEFVLIRLGKPCKINRDQRSWKSKDF